MHRKPLDPLEIICESPANLNGHDRFMIEDGACERAYDACGIELPSNVRSVMFTERQATKLRDWLTAWIATQRGTTQ
jgi:hypothetical protein